MEKQDRVFWLIYSKEDAEKNRAYISFYEKEGSSLGLSMKLLYAEQISFGIKDNGLYMTYEKEELACPVFIIVRTIYPFLSRHLECMGYSVWNNSMIAEICNDKAKTYQFVSNTGIKMPDTRFIKHNFADTIMDEYNNTKENFVIKSIDGHGGSSVFLYNELNKQKIVQSINSSDMVVQPLIGTKHKDVRVYVIGDQIIAAILRTGKDDFRSNYSLGGDVQVYSLSDNEIAVVNKIITSFDFGLVGIDFIFDDNNELIFNEIEDVVGARMLYQCTNVNLVRLYLEYIMKKEGVTEHEN